MDAGLIVVAVLVALLIAALLLLARPGGGIYIDEKQTKAIRSVHKQQSRRKPPAP